MSRPPTILAFFVCGLASIGCREPPPEPIREAASARPAPTTEPLVWTAPPAWSLTRSAQSGEYRARYEIPAQGDAHHPAELLVSYLGKGTRADIPARLTELEGSFDAGATSHREHLTAGPIAIEVLEIAGTYKFPMGPEIGRKKRPAAQVLKENWRALCAGVTVPERGAWLFRMVGPDDTVSAARSAFVAMLRGLR